MYYLKPSECGRRDSNSHEGCSLEPKSSASTNFATSAFYTYMILKIVVNYKIKLKKNRIGCKTLQPTQRGYSM